MVIQPDFKNNKGLWVQRSYVGEKYVWTVSGVLWNNIKERCTVGGSTQTREPTYINCKNSFKDFQSFTEWHRNQVGYGLGYQLDADILKDGVKEYSESKCVLIPSELNKFLQSYKGKRGKYPQGMYLHNRSGKLHVRIEYGETKKCLGLFPVSDLEKARSVYKQHKDEQGRAWYDRLLSGRYTVDNRVIEYMSKWEYICDWRADEQNNFSS